MHKRKFSKEFKTKVAVEALKGVRTIREISVQYQIHPNLVMKCSAGVSEREEAVNNWNTGDI